MLNNKSQIPYHIKLVLLMEVSFLTCNQGYVHQNQRQGIWTVFLRHPSLKWISDEKYCQNSVAVLGYDTAHSTFA